MNAALSCFSRITGIWRANSVGGGGVYVGVTLIYCLAFYCFYRLPRMGANSRRNESVVKAMLDGLGYLRDNPMLVALLVLEGICTLEWWGWTLPYAGSRGEYG